MGNRWLIKLLIVLFFLPALVLADDVGAPDTGIQKDGTTVTTASIPFAQGMSMALDKNFWMDDTFSNGLGNRIFTASGNFTLNVIAAGERNTGRQAYGVTIAGGNGSDALGGNGGPVRINGGATYGGTGGDVVLFGGPNLDAGTPGIVAVASDVASIPFGVRGAYNFYVAGGAYVDGDIFARNLAGGVLTKTNASTKALQAAVAGTDYESPLTFSSPLSRSTNTISVGNAAADGTTKGVAAFNSTNFSASSGVINTVQNINSTATPTFGAEILSSATAEKIKLQRTMSTGDAQEINAYNSSTHIGRIRFSKGATAVDNVAIGVRFASSVHDLFRNDEDTALYIDEDGNMGSIEIGTSVVHMAGDLFLDGKFQPDKMSVNTNFDDIEMNIAGKSMFSSNGGLSYAGGLASTLGLADGGIMTSDGIYFVGTSGSAGGEWRIKQSGSGSTSDLVIQKFVSGAWTTKSTISH